MLVNEDYTAGGKKKQIQGDYAGHLICCRTVNGDIFARKYTVLVKHQ